MEKETKLNWVQYTQEKACPIIENGFYKSPCGQVMEFISGPRDEFIWNIVDGRIDKGLDKKEFLDNFVFVSK